MSRGTFIFVVLRDIMTSLDIFWQLKKVSKNLNIDFDKCSSITIDSARAMTDLKKGFADQLIKIAKF